jgi:hypothetical protein
VHADVDPRRSEIGRAARLQEIGGGGAPPLLGRRPRQQEHAGGAEERQQRAPLPPLLAAVARRRRAGEKGERQDEQVGELAQRVARKEDGAGERARLALVSETSPERVGAERAGDQRAAGDEQAERPERQPEDDARARGQRGCGVETQSARNLSGLRRET